MFTLGTLNTEKHQEDGAWLHLCYPGTTELAYIDEKKEKPARVKLKGLLSNAGKGAIVAARNKAMKEAISAGKSNKKHDDETLDTFEEKKKEDARELSDLAIDWENILDEKGKPVAFSVEAFYNAVCNAHDLRRQCRDFVQNQKAFTPA